ncbi:MAG: TonB family protein [bacterium]
MMPGYEWLAETSLWWWPRFADHLWQTTLFGLAVLVASFAVREGPARLRHNFWLLASAKFIIPAALFVLFAQQAGIDSLPFFHGDQETRQNALLVNGVTQPASALAFNYEVTVVATSTSDHKGIYFALTLVWLAGCLLLLFVWGIRRRRFLRSLKLGRRLQSGREWQVLTRARETLNLKGDVGLVLSPLKIEPAVWRVWRPIVVMPESIANQLDDEELEAIMLHELVHIQRRDNLIANLQLALCALLWFHPLVWFISRKLFDEREQACDERVMEVCGAPEAYASSILKVVRFCFGWRVAGVTGAASGSNLRRRIENIMSMGNTKRNAGAASRLLASALVGIALLVLVGAGVYSKARGLDAKANDVGSGRVETMPVNEAELGSNLPADGADWAMQKTKPARTAPPEPSQPPQPGQPPQPAQAPEPAQGPEPTQAPQPVHVPEPSRAPEPAHAPQPSSAPKPAHAPHPSQPPQPGSVGVGVSNGAGIGVGRGIGRVLGVGGGVPGTPSTIAAPASPAAAPPAPAPPASKQEKSKTKSKEESSDRKKQEKVEKGALIEAPHPVYPEEAKKQKIEGVVSVTITVGEDGNVIFAKAKSGPEPLYGASEEAAYKARFKPTTKDGKPVKVTGVMSYNFVADQK